MYLWVKVFYRNEVGTRPLRKIGVATDLEIEPLSEVIKKLILSTNLEYNHLKNKNKNKVSKIANLKPFMSASTCQIFIFIYHISNKSERYKLWTLWSDSAIGWGDLLKHSFTNKASLTNREFRYTSESFKSTKTKYTFSPAKQNLWNMLGSM